MAYEEQAQDERAAYPPRQTGSITERAMLESAVGRKVAGDLDRLDAVLASLDAEYEGLRASIDAILDPSIDAPRPTEISEERPMQSQFANRVQHLEDLVSRLATLRAYVRL